MLHNSVSLLLHGFIFVIFVSVSNTLIVAPHIPHHHPSGHYPVVGVNVLPPNGGSGKGRYIYRAAPRGIPTVYTGNCTISSANLDKGTEPNGEMREYVHSIGFSHDDAGHILANRLGGSGIDAINIFPQSPSINRGIYREFEDHIYKCVSASQSTIATLTWVFHYFNGNQTRPDQVQYTASFQGGSSSSSGVCKTVSNSFPN
jgi:hypothetical protein